MEHIINQAPENISEDKIMEIYIKNSSNVIDTLVELWDIKEEKKKLLKNNKNGMKLEKHVIYLIMKCITKLKAILINQLKINH